LFIGSRRCIHYLGSRAYLFLRNQYALNRILKNSNVLYFRPTGKFAHRGWFQETTRPHCNFTRLIARIPSLQLNHAKRHPLSILMQPLHHHIFIGKSETVFQYVQPRHQPNLISLTPSLAVIMITSIKSIYAKNVIPFA
jgi:hypothetical protein